MGFSPLTVQWTTLKSRGRVILWAVMGLVGRLAVAVALPAYHAAERDPTTPVGGTAENYWSGGRARAKNWETCVLGLGYSAFLFM